LLFQSLYASTHICPDAVAATSGRAVGLAVGGILGASSVVVVSGESTSMVSEAASSGKYVIAFKPRRKSLVPINNKHETFLKRLSSAGFICLSDTKDLKDNIIGLLSSYKEPKRLNDNEKVYEAVKKIV
jgi:mitochondrial fission protein ELM1